MFLVRSDGLSYAFLLKQGDDLRKDQRVNELGELFNVHLAKATEAKQRNLAM